MDSDSENPADCIHENNDIRSNNLKSLQSNYATSSSDDNESVTSSPLSPVASTSNSSYKILTPFVPYKNPFIHEEEEEEENDNRRSLVDDEAELLTESDSKRHRAEFSAKSSASKIYRSKKTTPENAAATTPTGYLLESDEGEDVDLSDVTINPRILQEEATSDQKRSSPSASMTPMTSTSSVKRKRDEDSATTAGGANLDDLNVSDAMDSSASMDDRLR